MIHKFSRYLILATCCAAITSLPLAAESLESLLGSSPADGLIVGDIDFYDFGFSASCAGGPGGTITSCATLVSDGLITGIVSETNPGALNIIPDTSAGVDGFDIQGGLKTLADGSNPTTLDVVVTYDAEVVGSSNVISDVYLAASPVLVGDGANLQISETAFNLSNGAFLGSAEVYDPPPSLSDDISFAGVPGISVAKDIYLDSGAGRGSLAEATYIHQGVSQTPEPRAYAVALGLFFALFFVIKRRRQQTATA